MGLLDEQKIVSRRLLAEDNGEEIVLECGHTIVGMVPLPEAWDRMRCGVCIKEFTERYSAYKPPKKEQGA